MAYSHSLLRHASLVALALAVACSGDGGKPPIGNGPGPAPTGDGDGDGDGTGGGKGEGEGTGGSDSLAAEPVVELSFEGGTPDLAQPAKRRITVICKVIPGDETSAAAIDRSTVSFRLLDPKGEEVEKLDGALVEGSQEEFSVEFVLEALPTGTYSAICQGSTVGTKPATGHNEQAFLVDGGPAISLVSPEANTALRSGIPQTFRFEVLPSPLIDDDPGAAVDSVTVSVKGQQFQATLVPDTTDQYKVEINFADTNLFPDLPNGEILLTVEATNSRGDYSSTSSLTAAYDLDGTGPVIALTSPKDSSIIGGTVLLKFTVTDDISGIDQESVTIKLNDKEFIYNVVDGRWLIEGTKVTFQFESAEITGSKVQTNVDISARDKAGNPAVIKTATYLRDEQAPIVSLTPPRFRALKTEGGMDYCSRAFYPTGDATRGGLVPETVLFRAAVWDETNTSQGQQVNYLSGVNTGSVELWVRKATDGPLLRDTNSDNKCDDIVVGDELSKSKQMQAIGSKGRAYFGDASVDYSIPEIGGICTSKSEDPPPLLCDPPSDLTVVAHHSSGKAESIVYGLPAPAAECTGGQWELPSALPDYEGWVCVAARAYDKAGNRGVSKAIAVCLDKPDVGDDPACKTNLENPPNCQGSCTDPKDFDPAGIIYEQ